MRAKVRLLGTALGAIFTLSLGTTVHAAPAPQEGSVQLIAAGSCSAPNFCLFDLVKHNAGTTTSTNLWRDIVHDDDTFEGNHWRDGNGNLTNILMDNDTSSVKNRAGCFVYLYSGPNYTGNLVRIPNGYDVPELETSIGDNSASSADFSC